MPVSVSRRVLTGTAGFSLEAKLKFSSVISRVFRSPEPPKPNPPGHDAFVTEVAKILGITPAPPTPQVLWGDSAVAKPAPPTPATWKTAFKGREPEVDWNRVHDMGLHAIGNDPAEKELDGFGPRSQGVFHPSAGLHPDTGNCPRAVLFDLMHAKRSPTKILTTVLKSMDNGTGRHAGMQKLFVHMAARGHAGIRAVYQDVRLSYPAAAIGGSADMIIVMQSGAVYLIDIKTASPAKFKNLFKPSWEHTLQVNTYMGMAGIKTGYVLTEDRATLEFAKPVSKFRIDFSEVLWKATLEYCHGMLRVLKTQRLPEYDEAVCKPSLMFCDYEAVCIAERKRLATFSAIDRRPEAVKKHHLRII